MKRYLQHIIYYLSVNFSKFYRSIINAKSYSKISENANTDIDDSQKAVLKNQLKQYHKTRPLGPGLPVCHAPFASIYFGFNGDIIPCCFNRSFIYGRYPQNKPSEILNNSKRKQLLDKLNNHDFSLGCQHCRSQIVTGNFEGVEARLYDKMRSKTHLSEIIFELDNTCNLECIMCHEDFSSSIARAKGLQNKYTSPYDDEFVENIKPQFKKLKLAKFLGGEPFLIKIYYKIWEELMKENPNCFINLQTNGTIYNDKIENLLRKGKFQIGVSIDSLQKDRFEAIRKNANFDVVMANLDKFIKYTRKSGSFVNISVCPMQQNWEEIPDLLRFCNNKNVYIYLNTVYTESFDLREFSADKLFEIYEFYKKAEISANNYISKRNLRFFKSFKQQVYSWYIHKKKEEEKQAEILSKQALKYEFTADKLIALILERTSSNSHYYTKFEKIKLKLPEKFLLSELHIERIADLSSGEVENVLINFEDTEILKLLHNFIETGWFNPEK
ncbi:MAG: radical SAM protein [Bacteroidales bacterium]|nr:radical SAM protein [Bacteroidales bacterium]